MKEINYLGKTYKSDFIGEELEHDKILEIRNGYYNECKEKAIINLKRVLNGEINRITDINSYYFERLQCDVVMHHSKWSVNEVLECNDLMQVFINRAKTNKKVFNGNVIQNFKTSMRLGGKGIAQRPSNFPLKECKKILSDYAKGKNYIDTSCGWGVRMLASACLDIDYVGFEVNEKLIYKLNELGNDIKKIKPNWGFKIIPYGSEFYVQKLSGKSDIMFTSPPYFMLEDYRYGEQSTKKYTDYHSWVDNYLNPLAVNSYNYCKYGTLCILNVKGYKNFGIDEDTVKSFTKAGFTLYKVGELKNITRVAGSGKIDNSEDLFIFIK